MRRAGQGSLTERTRCAPWCALGTAALAALWAPAPCAAEDDDARARLHFIQHCTGCHLADGSGAPARGIPSMQGTLGDFLKVPGGREFIVQVPGVMNSSLSDRDIASLMNWLLTFLARASTPPGTPPYTAQEIARLRQSRPLDVMATRRQLMARLRAEGPPSDGPGRALRSDPSAP